MTTAPEHGTRGAQTPTVDGGPTGRFVAVLATVGTEVFGPVAVVPILCLAVGWHATHQHLAGLGYGLLLVAFTTLIPFGIILWQVRRGAVTDHYIGRREQRRNPMLLACACTAVATAGIWVLDAPRELVVTALSILVSELAATVVNAAWWKMSIHTSTAAGATVIAVAVFGPWALLAVPAVAVNGWSRVHLKAHTVAQVLAGTCTGALLTALVLATVASA